MNKQNGLCQQISPLCQTSNNNNGECLTCYGGYDLINGQCILGKDTVYTDLLCRSWLNGKCQ